ncbi:hypothetical protein HDU67_008620 [Dinochytrium kinnereticum]|nr:hypothetical protein HDU67_008620 [Dinochytrium kinnereticum]
MESSSIQLSPASSFIGSSYCSPSASPTNCESIEWRDEPRGKESLVGNTGIWAYFSVPEMEVKSDSAVVLITDAFGWKLPTFRLIADHIANRTHSLVVIPDLLEGGLYSTAPHLINPPSSKHKHPVKYIASLVSSTYTFAKAIPSLVATLTKFPESKALSLIDDVFFSLISDYGISSHRIGVQGYGWGGNLAVQLAGRHKSLSDVPHVRCISISDPTHISGLPAVRSVKVPSLWCCSTQDHAAFPVGFREAIEKVMREKGWGLDEAEFWVAGKGCGVGFASRGFWGGSTARGADEAVDRAVEFFERWL